MLFEFLAMIPQAGPVETAVPTLSSVYISSTPGGCAGGSNFRHVFPNASMTLNWSSTNFNSALHEYRIYQDNVLVSTQDTSTSYTKTIYGAEGVGGNQWEANWTFRVDIVRKSDNVVRASITADPFVQFYGDCGSLLV